MVEYAVIRRRGVLLEVSYDGERLLPGSVIEKLTSHMSYMRRIVQFGPESIDYRSGAAVVPEMIRENLYMFDDMNRLVCQKGYLPRICSILREQGYEPLVLEDAGRPASNAVEPQWDRVFENFTLRPRQDSCLVAIATNEGGIIDAVTAFGKTYAMAMVCKMYPKATIDIVVKSKSIVNTIRRLLTRWIANVGQVGGGSKTTGRVTIYTADSLHHSDYSADILMADECVTGDAMVAVPSGSIPLKDVVVGHEVMCYDGTITARRVARVWARGPKPLLRLTTSSGRTIRCTDKHPIMTGSGWVAAGNLQIGQEIVCFQEDAHTTNGSVETSAPFMRRLDVRGGSYCNYTEIAGMRCENLSTRTSQPVWRTSVEHLTTIERLQQEEDVYDIEVVGCHNFFANGILVHNCHQLMTDRYVQLLSRYWYAKCFGFTASKETRMDNAHHRMEAIFGPTIFKIDYQEAERLGLVVPIVVNWLKVEMSSNPISGAVRHDTVKRHGIWRNATRNELIAEAALFYHRQGMQTLILVETVEHALHLKRLLPDFEVCYSEGGIGAAKRNTFISLGILQPDTQIMTASLREELRIRFEQRDLLGCIATGVWSTGVSFNSLEVLIRAEGGGSETANIQLPGRVCRINDSIGKQCGLLVDCCDVFDRRLYGRSRRRFASYKQNGWTQGTGGRIVRTFAAL